MSPVTSARCHARALTLLAAALLAACGAGSGPGSPVSLPQPAGNSDVLTRDQIELIHANSMEQLLTRRFNGVQVSRVDGELTIRIRGGDEPLLVLDGIPGFTMAAFWTLDPTDLEEIRVLRETAAGAYGLRGGNGVILVTTRKR